MLSDDELLDRDASDSIFAKETPWEDSPRTFTRHLINCFGISSKGGDWDCHQQYPITDTWKKAVFLK